MGVEHSQYAEQARAALGGVAPEPGARKPDPILVADAVRRPT